MSVARLVPAPSATPRASSRACRRQRIAAAVVVALVCSGATSCTRTEIALSATAIGVAAVGTTVGVTYAVKHHNHTLQGCVLSDASGLKLRTSEVKVYTLKGETASLKPGDRVNLNGSKVKKVDGNSTSVQVFEVQKLNKIYGPCSANAVPAPTSTR